MTDLQQKLVLRLLWSLWTEMGVPGVHRRHERTAVDPEPLIAWTPHLALEDSRLLGLAFDWCVSHREQIAKIRFARIAQAMPEAARKSFAAFNGALAKQGVAWKPRGKTSLPLDVGRSTLALPLERSSLVRFRIRALCGLRVRPEVLAQLLAARGRPASVSELMPAGVSRRSVERVLDSLAAANIVMVLGSERRRRFRLRGHKALETLVQGQQLRWHDWHARFALVAAIQTLWEQAGKSPALRRIAATKSQKALALISDELGGIPSPPAPVNDSDPFKRLVNWGQLVVSGFANRA